jgi:hypothetical protein
MPLGCGLVAALFVAAPVHASGQANVAHADETLSGARRTLVRSYCVTCHNERRRVGGLALDAVADQPVAAHAEIWEHVIKKLRIGAMPPAGMPRPERTATLDLMTELQGALDRAAVRAPNPGHPAVHRLNRTEYVNAVRDLLSLDVDGRQLLPADDTGYGFDNIGDVLTLSPALLERYLLAAQKISRIAIGDPSTDAAMASYTVPYLTLLQDERMSEDLPFGSRGGVAVHHQFPVDGEYEIRIRLQRNALDIGNEIRGADVMNTIDLRIDGARVTAFTIGGRTYGKYAANIDDTEDERLRVRVPVRAGMRVIGATFREQTWDIEGVGLSRLPPASHGYAAGRGTDQNFGKIEMGIDRVDVLGPFGTERPDNTPSRRRIFSCRPSTSRNEEPCARHIVTALAHRAYRRPVTEKDLARLLAAYRAGRRTGDFDDGIQAALERVLVSPYFLLRQETDPDVAGAGVLHRISDLELASRLSFFLWSSIPDDELLRVAERGRLRDSAVLTAQVRRMIADPRATALVSNFFGQWLLVRNLGQAQRDFKLFPEFDENLRSAFQQETQLFLESQLREDRPVTELLTADYTFVNERLARHYDIPNVYGTQFRRVQYPDGARGGLFGHGSVLTVTAYADRTSVVLRGKWILENVLGTPPPPPPPNVPPLGNTQIRGTLRQRMEQHRKNPVCASCHSQIDPLGFALENFNAIGQWRVRDGEGTIDPSGVMVDGSKFSGPEEFRTAVLTHQDAFLSTVTEKLLTYALGRGVESYDMPAVRAIVREAGATGNRWSALILAIVRSTPFQLRIARS